MPDTNRGSRNSTGRALRRAALLAAAFAAPAAAQSSPEGLVASAAAGFQSAWLQGAAGGFRPTLSAGMPRLDAAAADDFSRELRDSATMPRPLAFPSGMNAKVADLELAPLLNRHLKTSLRYRLGGRTVWFSGAYDSRRNDYISVLVDGYAPLYFDAKALLDEDQHLSFGGASYTLSIEPNIFHKTRSEIVLKNDADDGDSARFSVQKMLDAISAAGLPVVFSNQTYKLYYADGVGGDQRMIIFFYCGGGSHVDASSRPFLIPENRIPEEGLAVPLSGGKLVGLARRGGAVQIFERR